MTTIIQKAILNNVNEIQAMREERAVWQSGAFATANDGLYDMLSRIYDRYMEVKQEADWTVALRDGVLALNEKFAESFNSANPHLINVMVKFVFFDKEVDARRISAYVRVLKLANMERIESGQQLISFIKDSGGIEAVRRQSATSEKVTAEEHIRYAKEAIAEIDSYNLTPKVNITTADDAHIGKAGEFVSLLCMVGDDGKLTVYDASLENTDDASPGAYSRYGLNVVKSAILKFAKFQASATLKRAKRTVENRKSLDHFNELVEEEKAAA